MNTTLCAFAAAVGFGISVLLGKWLIPFLHKLKYGQPINDIGPTWHKNKQGTPTMGGIMFITATVISCVIFVAVFYFTPEDVEVNLVKIRLWTGIVMSLAFAAIGFFDDYLKVKRKDNKGLSAKQKLLMQLIVGLFYAVTVFVSGQTTMNIPFIGNVDIGLLFIPASLFIITATVNAVNLTDGVDGLASSVTFVAALFFIAAGNLMGVHSASIAAAALAGALLGFLVYNFHPAKVFMGDVGSMFLGGMVCALAFGINQPILILPVGIIYFIETLSVMIQVTYFKLTKGKRLFKMTPIHHQFEMSGWSEMKIVSVFSFVTIIAGVICLALVMLGYC